MPSRSGGRSSARTLRIAGWLLLLVGTASAGTGVDVAEPSSSYDVPALAEEPGAPEPAATGAPLTIDADDARYLTRIDREQETEVVYCGMIRGTELEPRLARLVETSRHAASFDVGGCVERPYDALAVIHTHPGDETGLSSHDRALLDDESFDYLCVQTGPIDPATAADGLTCYVGDAAGVERVPVTVG